AAQGVLVIVPARRAGAPGLRPAGPPPPAHARSRAPAPPACEHPASPRPHPAASSRSLTRSRSTCVRTPSVATPAPRRQLTLAHALPLHLRANTQRRPARTPPPTHARPTPPQSSARSPAHACRTRNARRRRLTPPPLVAWR